MLAHCYSSSVCCSSAASRRRGRGFNSLTATAAPAASFIINTAVAGQQPTDYVDVSTTFTVGLLLGGAKKLAASLSAPMPAGVTLTATLPAVGGGSSSVGPVTLTNTARDVMVNFTNVWNQTRTITYRLSATVAAGVVPNQSRSVILTLVAYPQKPGCELPATAELETGA